jgi:enoyl-CoA hydratase/carnithine racemase
VGLGRATELLMLGEEVDADRAVEIGLASKVEDDDQLPRAATVLARRLAEGPGLAFASTKMLLTREIDMGLGPALELEAMAQALLMTTRDHAEFYAAFQEGRSPTWTGR